MILRSRFTAHGIHWCKDFSTHLLGDGIRFVPIRRRMNGDLASTIDRRLRGLTARLLDIVELCRLARR